MKGADYNANSITGSNIFHLLSFMGHFDCLTIIDNYLKHMERMKLVKDIKHEMKILGF